MHHAAGLEVVQEALLLIPELHPVVVDPLCAQNHGQGDVALQVKEVDT